ncbi:MAG: hypothetical protein U0670_07165 [Anaerolineae bacterium]
MNSTAAYEYAADRYERRYYEGQDWLTPVESISAEDGTYMRHSFRANQGSPNGEYAPGQVDVFYLRRDPYLVIVETYSADSSGSSYVDTLQAILDSLRILG